LPFHDTPKQKSSEQILKGKFSYGHPVWRTVSTQAKCLINEMLTVDPKKRPSINDVLQHKWLRDDAKVLQKARMLMSTKRCLVDTNSVNIEEPFSNVRITETVKSITRQRHVVNNKTLQDINQNMETDFTFTPPPKRQRVE
jgi:serine/threonine protein kinase